MKPGGRMTDLRNNGHTGGMAVVAPEALIDGLGRPERLDCWERSEGRAAARTPGGTASPPMRPPTPPFDEIYETWFDYVFRTARRLGVEEGAVDDVVQEVFVVVHRRLSDFEGRSTLKTWLFGIAFRVVREHRRALGRRRRGAGPTVDELDPPSPRPGPGEAAERAQAARVVRALLDELDDDKREVFVLAELEGMTAPEIAEITGTKVNTVYSRLRAARAGFERALRARLAREQPPEPVPWAGPERAARGGRP
jgi:RNA polymerase sigma-70 factor (ECF subfamily)